MLHIFSFLLPNKKKQGTSLTKNVVLILGAFFLFWIHVDVALAANLGVSPSSVTTKVGKTFTVDLVE